MGGPVDEGPGIRVRRKRTFTVIYNDQFAPGMSLRAWGLYCHLSGKPDGWDARVYSLQHEFKEGRDAIYTALKELVELELVAKEEWMDGNLKRTRYVLEVEGPSSSDKQTRRSAPDTGFQGPGSQDPESPGPEDPLQGKKDSISTEVGSTDPPGVDAAASGTLPGMPSPPRRPKREPDPFTVSANRVCSAWWDALRVKPSGKRTFANVALLVAEDLANGRAEDEVSAALHSCGVAVTRAALNYKYESLTKPTGWDGKVSRTHVEASLARNVEAPKYDPVRERLNGESA